MAAPLVHPRTGCALQGALEAALAIPGVVPVVHSTAGCAHQAHPGASSWTGSLAGLGTPSTNLSEKHVVFGGTARLREELKNAGKVVDGELALVLTGCAAEMVGDDVAAMVKEAVEAGQPAAWAATAGFRGSARQGSVLLLKALAESGARDQGQVVPGLVNVLGIVPGQDFSWEGDLEELGRVLGALGLTVNRVFGQGGGLHGVQALGEAALSLAVTPWGAEAARDLNRRFGTPWLHLQGLPVGAAGVSRLVESLIAALPLDAERARAFAAGEARREAQYLAGFAETCLRENLQLTFSLAAPSALTLGLARHLVETAGWLPAALVITDDPPGPEGKAAREALERLAAPFGASVAVSADGWEIAATLSAKPADIVLGSALEAEAARDLAVPLLELAVPVRRRVALGQTVCGVPGGLALLRDAASLVLGTRDCP